MASTGRDRLRELLDAVLDGTADGRPASLPDMASTAAASPFHFTRVLSEKAGEPPVAMRRRVLLERAAWQLLGGATVTAVAFDAGYESVEGFSRAFARAFGHPPSAPGAGYWLPAPNGIHFHPPTSVWVDAGTRRSDARVTDDLVVHDLDDTRELLVLAKALPERELRAPRLPGATLISWHGPEESVLAVLENHVWTKQVWVAALAGDDLPDRDPDDDLAAVVDRHDEVAARWLATVRDIARRGSWDDVVVDALCDPPQSFVVGDVIAHVLTYAAGRRMVARLFLREAGVETGDGDPIEWSRARLRSIDPQEDR